MRALLLPVLVVSLSACSIIYKLPTRQGNVIEQTDLDKLKVGMTREQVKYVMGTPIAASPFRPDRWDYVGYFKSPRGEVTSRTVTLFFDQDALARLDGAAPTGGDQALSQPDPKAIISDVKKDKADRARGPEPIPSAIPPGPEQQP